MQTGDFSTTSQFPTTGGQNDSIVINAEGNTTFNEAATVNRCYVAYATSSVLYIRTVSSVAVSSNKKVLTIHFDSLVQVIAIACVQLEKGDKSFSSGELCFTLDNGDSNNLIPVLLSMAPVP